MWLLRYQDKGRTLTCTAPAVAMGSDLNMDVHVTVWLHVHLRVFFAQKRRCAEGLVAPRSPVYLVVHVHICCSPPEGHLLQPTQSDPRSILFGVDETQ